MPEEFAGSVASPTVPFPYQAPPYSISRIVPYDEAAFRWDTDAASMSMCISN